MLFALVTLQPDTPYYLIAETDTEVKGTSMVPEPSCLLLIAGGLAALIRVRLMVTRRPQGAKLTGLPLPNHYPRVGDFLFRVVTF